MHSERYRVPDGDVGGVPRRPSGSSPSARPACGRSSRRPRPGELEGRTDLFIHRGVRRSQVVDVLLTNFHLPRTTLLMMIDAFVGPRWRDLYADGARRGLPLPVASATPCCSTATPGRLDACTR